ncbi:MAG: alpha/beta fold hydrolase, partial [Acetobacteraceae bacterium]|nr:alpha/beta fold hydrolase [Acetobacteraceae bacterium]
MRFHFGDCVLDADRRELRRAGESVAVEPQVFDLLVHLVRERGRVVSKDDLLDAVWNGRIVSESTLSSRINAARRAVGDVGAEQGLIRTYARRGFRFVGEVQEEGGLSPAAAAARGPAGAVVPPPLPPTPAQEVLFFRAPDGVTLAAASIGEGPETLVKTANWLTHLEHHWRSPFWSHLLGHLARGRRLVRYDARGSGLSDRGVSDISFGAFLGDVETMVERSGLERFSLFGPSQGAAVAAAYAALHPERVSRLVLLGAYAQGRNRRGSEEERDMARAFAALIRRGWGDEHSAFMRAYYSLYFPGAAPEQLRGWAEMQRRSATPEDAMRIRLACDDIDVLDLLPRVRAPTLVLHCRGDSVAPFDQGRRLAAAIPGARFVTLESDNHVVLP